MFRLAAARSQIAIALRTATTATSRANKAGSSSQSFIDREKKYGAHNYKPIPVVSKLDQLWLANKQVITFSRKRQRFETLFV